jgi:Thiamine pyrophosphate enzyme, N-terminal TPP binding domain
MNTRQQQTMVKGSDLLVTVLENEGVDRIFGIPGEENLDVVESTRKSSIQLVIAEVGPSFLELQIVGNFVRQKLASGGVVMGVTADLEGGHGP